MCVYVCVCSFLWLSFEVAALPLFKDFLLSLLFVSFALLQLRTNTLCSFLPLLNLDTALRKHDTTIEYFYYSVGVLVGGGG